MKRPEAGVTLMEVTIAVTLLSLLTLGMAIAMRVGLSAFTKTDAKLMEIRRITGAQRILHDELEGLMPVLVQCGANTPLTGFKAAFFQGEGSVMRFVSTFSLEEGWRGHPQVLEMFIEPGEEGGVRLLVNEIPYNGIPGTKAFCPATRPDPATGGLLPQFKPVTPGPKPFVLADQLAMCRFSYYGPGSLPGSKPAWTNDWNRKGWPQGIRIEMLPMEVDPSKLGTITVTAPIHVRRDPEKKYDDIN